MTMDMGEMTRLSAKGIIPFLVLTAVILLPHPRFGGVVTVTNLYKHIRYLMHTYIQKCKVSQ